VIRNIAIFAALAAALPAAAQTPAEPPRAVLEEIVVTARKVEENLQQVPVAVTAISAETIENLGIQGLADVARFTSGFSFESFSGPLSAPVIRGQTQTRIDLPVQNVASFFNGVYLQRNYMVDASLLDLARIEVIKGPQSALYGRNAFSGAINYITRKPGNEFEASLQATVGSDEKREIRGSISGPVTDWLGVLLAAGKSEFDGTWENNHPLASQGNGTRDNLGGHDNNAFLAAVTVQPLESLSFEAAYSRSELDAESRPQYAISTPGLLSAVNPLNCSSTGAPGTTPVNRLYCGEIPTLPVLVGSELSGPLARPPGVVLDVRSFGQRGTSELASLTTRWEITPDWSVNYQLGYTSTSVNSSGSPARNATIGAQPFPGNPVTGLVGFDSQPNGSFSSTSHEVRVEWEPNGIIRRAMLGGFSSRARDNASSWSRWATPLVLTDPQLTFTFANTSRNDDVSSIFGLLGVDVTERFSITAEVRYTEETLELLARATSPGFIPNPLDSTSPIIRRQENDFDYVTPRLAFDYKLTESSLAYFSVGKGVKSGGQNVPGLDPLQDIYDPEENWSVELGSKNDFLDDRLRFNAAVYYIDWTGIQGSVARNYPGSGRTLGVTCFTACAQPMAGTPVPVIVGNLGDATVTGIEIDGAWLLGDSVTLTYALSYQDAQYKDGQISQRAANAENCDGIICAATVRGSLGRPISGAEIGGNTLERQPPFQGALGIDYTFQLPVLADAEWTLGGNVTFQDRQYADELNLATVPSRALFDAALRMELGGFTARLWARNLFDEEYVTSSLFLIGTDGARSVSYVPFLGEKRTVGLTVGYKF